ncbi:MAG TPA: phosphoglycerate kinase [Anaerolineaceae bacterium]|nr:phosphoglycerate kinase [Anaerolineaceae bacterium]
MFSKKTVRDIDVKGKKVLVRVDFNVPIKDGKVTDDTRVRAALPTIQYLLDQGASVILFSHLGRPKGGPDPKYSMKPVADYLGGMVKAPVKFAEEAAGPKAEAAAKALKPGEILVLENTRFFPLEEKNDVELAKQFASLADVYVMDAFGSAHRAHSSTEGVARNLPAVAGFLMEKEIQYLGQAITDPKRPFVAILGGAKISDKIGVIRNLLTKADSILIGGAMANTFFKAQGYPMGDSLVENEVLDLARELINEGGSKLRLPVDLVMAQTAEEGAETKVMPVGPVPDGWRVLDVGPETVENFGKVIKSAQTVVWNGPMGLFEVPTFANGTFGVARALADSSATTIVGGGDSAAAIQQSGLADKITHISTGGGASLEMLEGIALPGVAALQDK